MIRNKHCFKIDLETLFSSLNLRYCCFSFSFLGKAFEMAASKTKSRTIHDHFDPAGMFKSQLQV